jgi:wyosine [tRNA(Phe)-imidazoG37] synthetase (radical SAM superfamily)
VSEVDVVEVTLDQLDLEDYKRMNQTKAINELDGMVKELDARRAAAAKKAKNGDIDDGDV